MKIQPTIATRMVLTLASRVQAIARLRHAPSSIGKIACLPMLIVGAARAQEPSPSAQAEALLPHDLSPWGMFMHADHVVKAVMLGLALASLTTWTVWAVKTLELWRARRDARAALSTLNEARTLADTLSHFDSRSDPFANFVKTAVNELRNSTRCDPPAVKERVAWLLERLATGAHRRMGRGLGIVATIGATAPFVGLFGTVWGIMNSFIGISNAHTTNLAVVAPGIAEALLATALGLVAAIPAVVIYNAFTRAIGSYRAMLADGSTLVMRLVSRDLERPGVALSRAAAE